MTFKVIQGHCRCCHFIGHIRFGLILIFHCKYISLSCIVFEIITLICQKIKTSRDLVYAHLGWVCNHKTNTFRANSCIKFDDSILSHSREILGSVNYSKMDYVTRATPLSETIRRLTFDIACKHTKFDDSSFSRSRDISRGWEILECVKWLWPRTLRGQLVIWRLVLFVTKQCTKFEVCSFSHFEDISWVLKF